MTVQQSTTGHSGSGSPASAPRLGWTDVAVLLIVVGFAIFLIYRGMSVQSAAITAVSTVAGAIAVVLVPRKLVELIGAVHRVDDFLKHLPAGSGNGGRP